MSLNLNKVILAGRIASDFEIKQTPGGANVVTIRLAVTRRFTSRDTQKQPDTDFFNVTAWNASAEFIAKHFRKGSPICIVGRIQNRTWVDQEGQKRYATDVIAEEIHFVESKGSQGSAESVGADGATGYPSDGQEPEMNYEEIQGGGDLPF